MEQKKKQNKHASYVYSLYQNQPILYCSCCKKRYTPDEVVSNYDLYKSCPNCKAIMDGSEKED